MLYCCEKGFIIPIIIVKKVLLFLFILLENRMAQVTWLTTLMITHYIPSFIMSIFYV